MYFVYSHIVLHNPSARTQHHCDLKSKDESSPSFTSTASFLQHHLFQNQAANFFKSSRATLFNALSFVLSRCTFGTNPSLSFEPSGRDLAWSAASFHRVTHKHHLQPSLRPICVRSLPRDAENLRKDDVTVAFWLVSHMSKWKWERDRDDGWGRDVRNWVINMWLWLWLRSTYQLQHDYHDLQVQLDNTHFDRIQSQAPCWRKQVVSWALNSPVSLTIIILRCQSSANR